MKLLTKLTAILSFNVLAAQQMPTQLNETHPSFTYSECTADGNCKKYIKSLVLDSNWRWTDVDGINCYTGTEWNETYCSDPDTCAKKCSLEGGDYENTYGITTPSDNQVRLAFSTYDSSSNLTSIGSRLYMLDDSNTYKKFYLKNQEFAFDVDISTLGCGLNGALYLVEMDADGDVGQNYNSAGAQLGTGYCDSQCPHDLKFINGEANLLDWTPIPNSSNSGDGRYGTCCFELDIWEANARATQMTPHTCTIQGQYRCENETECGDIDAGERNNGVCDKNGCDFNPSRLGFDSFFGNGSEYSVDTSRPFTVVTQFITSDNTTNGDLVEMRRFYVQDNQVIKNIAVDFGTGNSHDSITDAFCTEKTDAFADAGDVSSFADRGGMKAMGQAMDRGLVLVMSLWDDYEVAMIWLDAQDPPEKEYANISGAHRGPCSVDSGKPWVVEVEQADAYVTFGDVRVGDIGFTMASLNLDDDNDDSSGITHCSTDLDCKDAANSKDTICVVASDNSWDQCISCDPIQFQYECPYFQGSFKSTAEATCGLTCDSLSRKDSAPASSIM
uniref:cellulose 1,4-beta-cellobiosidase (non-reducing end) n=1 Tax=Aureoumbra lagunensis TaxID=44058 RepID=A0A7S3JRJ8_9STRA